MPSIHDAAAKAKRPKRQHARKKVPALDSPISYKAGTLDGFIPVASDRGAGEQANTWEVAEDQPSEATEVPLANKCGDALSVEPEETEKTGNESRVERRNAVEAQASRVPHGKHAMHMLAHLARMEKENPLGRTHPVTRRELADQLAMGYDAARMAIYRLKRAGLISVLSSKRGARGYACYAVAPRGKEIANEVGLIAAAVEAGECMEQVDPSGTARKGDSSYQDTRMLAKRIKAHLCIHGLDRYRIGVNDVLPFVQNGPFTEEEVLLESLEHLAFYLQSEDAKSIRSPKAWVVKQLARGYYGEPEGFLSLAERQAAKILQEREAKAARLRELERSREEADFLIWCSETPDERKKEILDEVGKGMFSSPHTQAAISVLREAWQSNAGISRVRDSSTEG